MSTRHRRAALRAVAAAIAATVVVPAARAHAQAETALAQRATQSAQSQPNGDLLIPFTIGPASCTNHSRVYVVSMRVHNVLAQPVGIPMLVTGGAEQLLNNLRLPCGRYLARWNGRHVTTGRRLPPGVYLTELVIDGQRITRKVTLDR